MTEKRMEEWYSKFLGVMDHFKKNHLVSVNVRVHALESGSYVYSLSVHVWEDNEREMKAAHYVDVRSFCEMDEDDKKAWAAIKRLMK